MPSEVAGSREPIEFSGDLDAPKRRLQWKGLRAESEAGALWWSGAASFPRRGRGLTRLVATGRCLSRLVAAHRDMSRRGDYDARLRFPRARSVRGKNSQYSFSL